MSQITKRALEASLKKMLLQKPLDKITIADLTDDCGVNRMTFYYHFKDIYDLVEWACVEDAARIARIPPAAEKLLRAFWPGPFTAVLKKAPQVPDAVTAGLKTVAVMSATSF